jgi:low affinity Fe/Cu permease
MEETNALLRALPGEFARVLREYLADAARTGHDLDKLSKPVQHGETRHKLVALPSKKQQAIEWLREHPADAARTGHDLESSVTPMGEVISYRTWNRAKNEFRD